MSESKICLVTGATAGIGQEAARVLAGQGMHVVVVGRNEQKTATTVAQIRQQTGNHAVHYLLADFASQASTRQLAAEFQSRYGRLDVLVNNAGAFFLARQQNDAGLELTFAVNHLGYFLLTHLLLDRLKASAPARIVNVSSNAHEWGVMDFADLQFTQGYKGMKAYARSKLANLLFTYELARRLEGSGVTVNALHPGFVATDLGANNIPVVGRWVKWLINRRAISVAEGAKTVVYLATAPEVEGVTGQYFVKCKAVPSTPASHDRAAAQQLWQISEELTGVG